MARASLYLRHAGAACTLASVLAGSFFVPAPGARAQAGSGIVINEAVTDPQTDWSTTDFDGQAGGGAITEGDEWVELYHAGAAPVNLAGYSLEFADSTPATLDFAAPGTALLRVFGSGSLHNFLPGDYLVIGNPPDAMNNTINLVLRDENGAAVDAVGLGAGGPGGDANGPHDEAVARVPNGLDTGDDALDFRKQSASLGTDNGGALRLRDHPAGQAGNAFASGAPGVSGATLFRFRLEAPGEGVTIGSLTLAATAAGVTAGDLGDVRLIVDANGDGAADEGEAEAGTLEAPLDLGDGITFAGLALPAGATVDYVLAADVANLAGGETLSLALGPGGLANVTGSFSGRAIAPTGAAGAASHVQPALAGQVVINEVVTDPQTDWSSTGFDGTSGGGTVSEVDEYVELYILGSGLNLAGWTIELRDSTPEGGSLEAGGAFSVSRYVGAGSFGNTAAGDYLVLGNPRGTGMNNNLYLALRDALGVLVDEVEIGDDFAGDGPGDGAPDGGSSSGDATAPGDEAIVRAPDGRDTDNDPDDFFKRAASPGRSNGGRLTLGEHALGQAGNAFLRPGGGLLPATGDVNLYRFSLWAEGESATLARLHFGFLTYELGNSDFGGLRLIEDTNGNGLADDGEPSVGQLEAPLAIADGLAFADVPAPQSGSPTNYLLRGSARDIRRGTLLDVWLKAEQIAGVTGGATGLELGAVGRVSAARHGEFHYTRDVLINEVLPHPGQDYNGDGRVNIFGDEYIELINVGGRPVHLGGWLLDDIPAGGSDIFRIHQGTIIEPGKALVMFRGTTRLALNDGYDGVQLRYPDGNLADEVFWDQDPGVDYSISRHGPGPGAFSYDWLPTPGMSNLARPETGDVPPLAQLAEARGWEDGAYLSIEGWVTGPHPLFGPRAIYVQDASGAGIVLYLAEGDFPPMSAGQAVRAYGYLRTVTGERELYVRSPYQMSLGEAGPGPAPQPIATGQVGEATEGRLVVIRGTVVRLEESAAWLDDGSGAARVFFAATTGLARPALARGQVLQVTGIVSEFTTARSVTPGYRVLVRGAYDLLLVNGEPAAPEAPAVTPGTVRRLRIERGVVWVLPRLGWWRPR